MSEFWDKRYSEGGTSGKGSIGKYRNWKWNKIKEILGMDFKSLIDVGCGDLSFLKHPIANKILKKKGFKYMGIDRSEHIIKRNRKLAPHLKFIHASSHIEQTDLRSPVVLCLDLLFHLMDDAEYELTIENLCKYSHQWIIIYTWKKNPFELQNVSTNGVYQKWRPLGEVNHVFLHNDFYLKRFFDSPFDQFGRMYFFKRLIY